MVGCRVGTMGSSSWILLALELTLWSRLFDYPCSIDKEVWHREMLNSFLSVLRLKKVCGVCSLCRWWNLLLFCFVLKNCYFVVIIIYSPSSSSVLSVLLSPSPSSCFCMWRPCTCPMSYSVSLHITFWDRVSHWTWNSPTCKTNWPMSPRPLLFLPYQC